MKLYWETVQTQKGCNFALLIALSQCDVIMNFITGFGFISSPQVTSEQLLMLLELLLEEEELSKEAMEALQRAYNLQRQDAEVRPHTQ